MSWNLGGGNAASSLWQTSNCFNSSLTSPPDAAFSAATQASSAAVLLSFRRWACIILSGDEDGLFNLEPVVRPLHFCGNLEICGLGCTINLKRYGIASAERAWDIAAEHLPTGRRTRHSLNRQPPIHLVDVDGRTKDGDRRARWPGGLPFGKHRDGHVDFGAPLHNPADNANTIGWDSGFCYDCAQGPLDRLSRGNRSVHAIVRTEWQRSGLDIDLGRVKSSNIRNRDHENFVQTQIVTYAGPDQGQEL